MRNHKHGSWLEREREGWDDINELKFCGVAAAVVGSAVVGGIVSDNASKRAAASNEAAINAASSAAAASEKSAADRLAFDKQVYTDGAADRQFASDTARKEAAWQEEDRTKYNALQDEQIARGKKFQGVEDQMLTDAQAYDTQERRDSEANSAVADVNKGFDNARMQQQRNLDRSGINPASGAALALDNQSRMSEALGMAGAANGARKAVETQGYARKMDAVGLGKGLIGNQATQASLQLNAGNSSVNNSTIPINVSNSANDRMSAGYGNAATGYANASNLFKGIGGLQMDSFMAANKYGASQGAGVGKMLMMGYGAGTGQWNPFSTLSS